MWFEEFEKRQSYLATKGDYYTHVTDIPPQYGPGQSVRETAEIFFKAPDYVGSHIVKCVGW
jgi:hypothetical protein